MVKKLDKGCCTILENLRVDHIYSHSFVGIKTSKGFKHFLFTEFYVVYVVERARYGVKVWKNSGLSSKN